jgi:5-hydroxyisourate hydrolase
MTITTHVLDTSIGRPASGVAVELYRRENSRWMEVSRSATNRDGRAIDLLTNVRFDPGEYRLIFDVGAYFRAKDVETFYTRVQIDFLIRDADAHYHVPLLVGPYGYSTYRGS